MPRQKRRATKRAAEDDFELGGPRRTRRRQDSISGNTDLSEPLSLLSRSTKPSYSTNKNTVRERKRRNEMTATEVERDNARRAYNARKGRAKKKFRESKLYTQAPADQRARLEERHMVHWAKEKSVHP